MNKFAITLILTFLFVGLISGEIFSVEAQTVRQSTHSSNSPVAYTQKGDITITINELKEIKKVIQEAIESHENGRDIKSSELKKRIAKIHETELHVLSKDAEAWAAQFITLIPIREDKLISLENNKRDISEDAKNKIPILFDYIFKDFDARILALKKYKSGINLIVNADFKLLVDSKSPDFKQYTPREVIFPNGNILKLFLNPGTLSNGLIKTYPSIRFCDVKNNNMALLNIGETTTFGNFILFNRGDPVVYSVRYKLDDDPINEEFKTGFSNAFDKVMQTMFLGIRETH